MSDLISRQAAIDAVLDRDRMNIEKYGRNAKPEEIMWTLEKLPPVQSDVPVINVGDMISKQVAMERLMAQNVIMDGSEYHNGFNAGVNRAQEVIRNLPTVQTEIIHCKDCLYKKICSWKNQGAEFCSFGERGEADG